MDIFWLLLLAAQVFDHVDSGEDLRELGHLLPLFLACFRPASLESKLLAFNLVVINGHFSVPIGKLHDLVIHLALVGIDIALLLFKHISELLLFGLQSLVRFVERLVASINLVNLLVRIVVLILDFFEEALVLLHCNLLLFNAGLLLREDLQLGAFAVDLDLTLFIFLSESGNILVAGSHLLRILVEEHSILDQTLL